MAQGFELVKKGHTVDFLGGRVSTGQMCSIFFFRSFFFVLVGAVLPSLFWELVRPGFSSLNFLIRSQNLAFVFMFFFIFGSELAFLEFTCFLFCLLFSCFERRLGLMGLARSEHCFPLSGRA